MRIIWSISTTVFILLGCCGFIPLIASIFDNSPYQYTPPPSTFTEADLVGTWQAKYGNANVETLVLKSDGTYQQVFDAPESDYFHESPWSNWNLEYSSTGKPKLHLDGMRYFLLGGANLNFDQTRYYDISEDEYIELTDKVVLGISGDETKPRGISLWHLRTDEDGGTAFFALIDE